MARNVAIHKRRRLNEVAPTAYVHASARVSRDLIADDYVYVAWGCKLDPGVRIGRYSMLAPGVAIVGDDHVWDEPGVPIQFAGRPRQSVTTVGDDVWIGYRALVRRGVTIGRGAIVAAHAVVTEDVQEFTVVAGVPARRISERLHDAEQRARHVRMLDGPLLPPSFASSLSIPPRNV